eukprot:6176638-Pleurochrysis_carterae.AAC.2
MNGVNSSLEKPTDLNRMCARTSSCFRACAFARVKRARRASILVCVYARARARARARALALARALGHACVRAFVLAPTRASEAADVLAAAVSASAALSACAHFFTRARTTWSCALALLTRHEQSKTGELYRPTFEKAACVP